MKKVKRQKNYYATKDFEDKNTKSLRVKIDKFIKDRGLSKLSVSLDIYTMTDNFVVIHGINSKDLAQGITSVLKDYKDYKVVETPIIISAENYTIVQIKKNIDDYLAGNLEDNPPPPNWDGTIEKAPVAQQPKPDENNEQQQPTSAIKQKQPTTIYSHRQKQHTINSNHLQSTSNNHQPSTTNNKSQQTATTHNHHRRHISFNNQQ